MTKRIIRLDPSTAEHTNCWRKTQLINRQGYTPKEGSAPLDFGQALHRAIGAWTVDRMRPETLKPPAHYVEIALEYYVGRMCIKFPPRDIDNLRVCVEDYIERYTFGDQFTPLTNSEGKVAVELPFAIEFYSNEHTDVILTGVIDAVGTWGGSEFCFKDIKHSSTTRIEEHLNNSVNRPQFHVYAWALQHEGFCEYYPPVVVDAIYIAKTRRGAQFRRRGPEPMEPHMVENTMRNMLQIAKTMAELPDTEIWPENYNACDGKYRVCEFANVCQLPHESQQMPLDALFDQRDYNPATFGD